MIEIPLDDKTLDLMAFDIADRIGDCDEYDAIDLPEDVIRRVLPVFLKACLELAAAPEGSTPDYALGNSVQIHGSRLVEPPRVCMDAMDSCGDDHCSAELVEVSEVENVAVAAIVAAAWLEREVTP